MKRLFLLVVLVAEAVAATGYYLGWFQVASTSVDGKPGVTVTVDKEKMHDDQQKARDKASDLKDKAKEKINESR
jgi:hypothetical protein